MGYTHFDKISGINGVAVGAKGSETEIISSAGAVSAASLALTGGSTQPVVKVTDAATYAILAADSGKVHIMPNLTADCVLSLPTPAAGLNYKFIYGGVAEDAQDWTFNTGSNTNYFLGGVAGHDDDDGDCLVVYPDGNSNSILKIDTPNAGTSVEFLSDGTLWYVNGSVVSGTDTHSAFSDQS